MCKDMPKDKVLEQYLAVIQKEKAKYKKYKAKKSKAAGHPTEEPDSDSSTDVEMNMIEINPTKGKKYKLDNHEKGSLENYEKSEEEMAYLASIYAEEEPESPTKGA